MIKTKLFFTLFAIAFVIPAAAQADSATSTPAATSTTTSLASTTPANAGGLQTPEVPFLVSKINEAKTLLDSVKLNYALSPVKNKKKAVTGYKLGLRDLFVAIYQPSTGQIFITGAMQNGKTLTFPDKNFDIKLTSFNGVNSKFKVSKPEGGYVIALKYLITPVESGSKASIENAMSETVYVPYSDYLNQPDVAAYGEQYMDGIIARVAADLEHLPSQAIPGKMIPEAINPSLIRALVYAEHTDTATALRGDVQGSINQVNVLFAGNEGDTYKYSGSSAGALGIAQFISSTYLGLVQRHPEAGLINDFQLGMADHYNSIKAMYMLLDDYAGTVRAKAVGFAEGQVFDYGAAAYNGGTTRVVNAVNTFGTNWNQDQSAQVNALQAQVNSLTSQVKKTKDKKTKASLQAQLNDTRDQLATLKSAALRNETVNYLQKIYKVIPVFNNSMQI